MAESPASSKWSRVRQHNVRAPDASPKGERALPERDGFADRIEASKAQLEDVLERALKRTNDEIAERSAAELADAVAYAMGPVSVATRSALSELHDLHIDAMRAQAKAYTAAFEMKLAQTRSATDMKLKNQKAEMEAAHAKELEEKFRTLLSGGDAALQDAYRKLEESGEAVQELQLKLSGLEQALGQSQAHMKECDSKAAGFEREAARLHAELASYQGFVHPNP